MKSMVMMLGPVPDAERRLGGRLPKLDSDGMLRWPFGRKADATGKRILKSGPEYCGGML